MGHGILCGGPVVDLDEATAREREEGRREKKGREGRDEEEGMERTGEARRVSAHGSELGTHRTERGGALPSSPLMPSTPISAAAQAWACHSAVLHLPTTRPPRVLPCHLCTLRTSSTPSTPGCCSQVWLCTGPGGGLSSSGRLLKHTPGARRVALSMRPRPPTVPATACRQCPCCRGRQCLEPLNPPGMRPPALQQLADDA